MEQDKWKNLDSQAQEILALLEKGLNEKEILETTGIAINNWHKNKKHCPKFSEGVEKLVNRNVGMIRKALWKMALGFEYEETSVIEKILPDGSVEKTTTTTTKYMPPHYEACREIMRIIQRDASGISVSAVNQPYMDNVGQTASLLHENPDLKSSSGI